MKTKTHVEVTEITHEDLVNLFSTVFYGSHYLSAYYDHLSNEIERDEEDCYEDIMAKTLLSGGKIYVTDCNAEDGEVYGFLPCEVTEDEDGNLSTTYHVTLASVVAGLSRAGSGTFNAGDDEWTNQTIRCAKVSFDSFADEDSIDFDLIRADVLMQIILFNEIVYV